MQSWKDSQGRTWTAVCNIGVALTLKDRGIDLFDPSQLAKVYSHPIEFLKLLAQLHQAEMTERGLSELDMLNLLSEVGESAIRAGESALIDFFRRAHGGQAIAAVLERAIEATQSTIQAQTDAIRGPRGDQAVQGMIGQGLNPLNKALDDLATPGTQSGA